MEEARIYLNGIDADSGDYYYQPMDSDVFVKQLPFPRQEPPVPPTSRGVVAGVDANDISSAGWAVVLPQDVDPRIVAGLQPLLDHRQAEAGALYSRLEYRNGETKSQFLKRYEVGPGRADPCKLPFYLLLVGGPDQIPFSFQYQLDVQYAVGRICFEHIEDYGLYAASVVTTEMASATRQKKVALFGVENHNDPLTRLSTNYLINPLAQALEPERDCWQIETFQGQDAEKARLAHLLDDGHGPSLLFTASHGVLIPKPHERRLAEQGSLICADWQGPGTPLDRDHYFAASDITQEANLSGLIVFLFACFSAGTPCPRIIPKKRPSSTEFIARLPMAMLARKNGALAVIAHVDEVFEHSFLWDQDIHQVSTFVSIFKSMMAGESVGLATRHIKERFADIATDMAELFFEDGGQHDTANNLDLRIGYFDSRNYIILGDPAVRPRVPSQKGD